MFRRIAPALVLFVLSPLIAEVLFGATPLSRLGGLLLVGPLYGGGVVLIRELARRGTRPWVRIGLLAVAYAIFEEGLALRSMFDPVMFNAGQLGGRAFGVNWVWVIWTVGYHLVWSISIPIALTEMLFPARRDEPWLRAPGMIVCGLLYAACVTAMGLFVPQVFSPNYQTPLPLFVGAIVVAFGLISVAVFAPLRERPIERPEGRPVHPAIWGLGALAMTILWFALLKLPHPLRADGWVLIPMVVIPACAAVAGLAIRRWSRSPAWTGAHTTMLALGAMITHMLWGLVYVTAANPLDHTAQAVLMGGAILTMLALAYSRRDQLQAAF
jgi:hypothetical protein